MFLSLYLPVVETAHKEEDDGRDSMEEACIEEEEEEGQTGTQWSQAWVYPALAVVGWCSR